MDTVNLYIVDFNHFFLNTLLDFLQSKLYVIIIMISSSNFITIISSVLW